MGLAYAGRGSNRRAPIRYGSLWWSKRRNETLLHVMSEYGDIEKAARVLGCPVSAAANQMAFLQRMDSRMPDKGTNAQP